MVMTPQRIQRRRTKGWRMPDGAIYVGRPTKWGNPFGVGTIVSMSGRDLDGLIFDLVEIPMTADMAVAAFRDLMQTRLTEMHPPGRPVDDEERAYVAGWRADLAELRGRPLACWCPLDQPCHADILLELANPAAA